MGNPNQIETKQCYHCGDVCLNQRFRSDERSFCCNGCLTVYSILKEGGLENFYHLDGPAGNNMAATTSGAYDYLAEESIAQKLLLFKDEQLAKVKLHLPGIHCSSCLWLLEHLDRLQPAVVASRVDFAKRTAFISFRHEEINLKDLAELLHSIGYAPNISLASENEEKKSGNKRLILQIGVTGFLFGNIMLLTFPEYLSNEFDALESFRPFFNWLILVLALPVLVFGARDYFVSSYQSLKRRRLTIDVPIAIGIVAIFLRSLYDIIMGIGPGYLDSMTGLVFFLLIGKWYQSKVYDRLSFDHDFASFFPISVWREKDGKEHSAPVMELEERDQIRILSQGIIPADCELLESNAKLDYSFVTGESRPVDVAKGQLIYAGGKNLGASVWLRVKKKVSKSYLVDLWNQPEFNKKSSSLSLLLDKASARFTAVVLSIAVLTSLYWAFADSSIMLNAVSSVLIVACPCALALSVPFALGNARRLMGKTGLYTKSTQVMELMDKITTIVFDKTGTITQSEAGHCDYEGKALAAEEKRWVASLAAQSAHPHSQIISQSLHEVHADTHAFDEAMGQGVSGTVEGHHIKIGSEMYVCGNANGKAVEKRSGSWISIDGEIKGRFVFRRELRDGVKDLMERLKGKYRLVLLSGDNEAEANMLQSYFDKSEMFFHQKPADKMAFIAELQSRGEKVMMIGDGLNDAGALQQSDVGIAVSDDINLFSPASDAILEGKSLPKLDRFLHFGANSNRIVKWSIALSLMYNVVGISFAVQGLLTPLIAAILMPLSSATIVIFATVATHIAFGKSKIRSAAENVGHSPKKREKTANRGSKTTSHQVVTQ